LNGEGLCSTGFLCSVPKNMSATIRNSGLSRFKVQAMWACVWVGVDSYLSPVCVFIIYLQH